MNRRPLSGAVGSLLLSQNAIDLRCPADARRYAKEAALTVLAELGLTERELVLVASLVDKAETGGRSLFEHAHREGGEITTEERAVVGRQLRRGV